MDTMTVRLAEDQMKALIDGLGTVVADKIMASKKDPEPWIDIEELSKKTGRSLPTLYRDVSRGLPCIRRGKKLGFRFTEVIDWLRRRQQLHR